MPFSAIIRQWPGARRGQGPSGTFRVRPGQPALQAGQARPGPTWVALRVRPAPAHFCQARPARPGQARPRVVARRFADQASQVQPGQRQPPPRAVGVAGNRVRVRVRAVCQEQVRRRVRAGIAAMFWLAGFIAAQQPICCWQYSGCRYL